MLYNDDFEKAWIIGLAILGLLASILILIDVSKG